jgi:hypothetical protein
MMTTSKCWSGTSSTVFGLQRAATSTTRREVRYARALVELRVPLRRWQAQRAVWEQNCLRRPPAGRSRTWPRRADGRARSANRNSCSPFVPGRRHVAGALEAVTRLPGFARTAHRTSAANGRYSRTVAGGSASPDKSGSSREAVRVGRIVLPRSSSSPAVRFSLRRGT